jgi:hypothetical protein
MKADFDEPQAEATIGRNGMIDDPHWWNSVANVEKATVSDLFGKHVEPEGEHGDYQRNWSQNRWFALRRWPGRGRWQYLRSNVQAQYLDDCRFAQITVRGSQSSDSNSAASYRPEKSGGLWTFFTSREIQ